MEILSSRLKFIKDQRGLSQREVAKIARTSETNISRYINYDREPCLDILANLASGLHVSTDFLLGLSDVENPKPDLTSEQQIILAALNRLSERDRSLIRSIIDDYLSPAECAFLDASEKRGLVATG